MSKYTKNQIEHAKQQVQLLLASRGMTRHQLSFELGYGRDAVTSWLNGRVQLGKFQVQCLCDYFGVTESSIVGDPEELADYKLYKDGRYICRGPLNEIDTKKVTVPQYVADWIEYCKKHNSTLFGCLDPANGFESLADETFEGDVRKCIRWCRKESNNFARAWLDGYEVEKEKLYEVKITASDQYLVKATDENFLGFLQSRLRTKFTKKELEKLGFGWVFNCPGIEIEEMEG